MSKQLSHQERADQFATWYKWDGCWVYGSRADALRVWQERGIVGRPACTPEAAALLTEWART